MNKRIIYLSAAGLLSCTFHVAAQSASTNAPIRLPEKVVTGDAVDKSITVPTVNEARKALESVPGGVNIIDASRIRSGRAATLKDVLEWSPGVYVQERFGAEEARLSIRGSGLQRTFHGRGLLIMADGVPLNLADGGFDMQAIEPLTVSYVEVLRGGNALQYGGSTLGGSINYISPTGYDASRIQARAEYGSYNYARGQISSGMVLGPADYYASYSHYSTDGYRDHALQNANRLFSNIGYRLSDNVETRFYIAHAVTDSELPGSITKAQLEANPRQAAATSIAGNQQRDYDLLRVANKTTWKMDNAHLDISTWWSHKDLYHPIPILLDQNSNDVGVNLHYVRDMELAGHDNRFTFGLRPTYGRVEDNRSANAFPGNFVNFLGPAANAPLSRTTEAINVEGYVQDEFSVNDKLALIGGLQATYAIRHTHRDATGVGLDSGTLEYTGISPKVGLRYQVTEREQLYGNVSRSYEPPSFGEISPFLIFPGTADFVPLKAQSAWTLELGTRGERGRFAWDVSAYHSWVDAELLALNNAVGVPLGTINATATRHLGIEAGLDTRILDGVVSSADSKLGADQLVFRQVYNWSCFEFASDPVYGGNKLAGIPEHFYRAELMYEHPCGFYGGPNVEWSVTKMPVDHANSWFADPYALVGIKLGYKSKKGFQVFVEARNLADKTYAATTGVIADALGADNANFSPGNGRTFYGGIEWKW